MPYVSKDVKIKNLFTLLEGLATVANIWGNCLVLSTESEISIRPSNYTPKYRSICGISISICGEETYVHVYKNYRKS